MKHELFNEGNRKTLADFCRKNHIVRMSLFGSTLRGEASPKSDIDLLVEFHPLHIPSLLRIAGMEIELSKTLGKKVDLRTAQDLSPYFRETVLAEARDAYVET